ncbi:glutaredoxin domain-containing protein [Hirsutella rhossiliensis]|uniref:Glutaredoxin domain-containing protein n=1 Tax=Hirsutella rhossiliensis TaxID=111463 RepID=A0A9P8N4Y0_9HYPO|nr:glutaredoxin domain-containing protein [Hirsutella rhossiliensis]KAH0964722.1 glutaredoxin domain-containing protein [Hirsutella rhossiliensis]
MAAAKEKVQRLIDDNAVIVFSKSYCPYCAATKKTLDGLNAAYTVVELDKESEGGAMQDELEKITNQRTVPNVIIKKKPIGGNSDVQAKLKSGELEKLLKDAGSLKA